MKRKVCSIFLILLLLLTGCASGKQPDEETGVQQEDTQDSQEVQESEGKTYDYVWNPHVYNEALRKSLGEEVEQEFYALVDAVLDGKESVAFAKEEDTYDLYSIARECFPPFPAVVSEYYYEDGELHLIYGVSDEERTQILEDFAESVGEILEASIEEGDSQTMAAIGIYHTYSQMVTYDYEALEDDEADVSSYRALTQYSGICQSFAPAYAYLCMQYGIDATTAGGLNDNNDAHEWSMLTLDGKDYYADVTFENGDGGQGLQYFGMTADRRAQVGGFTEETVTVAGLNYIWGKDVDVTDERFSPLWEAYIVNDIVRKDGEMSISCVGPDGTEFVFVTE